MTAADRLASLEDPQLRPFLPLLYVAWADLELQPEEAASVRERVAAQPWLRPAARTALEAWLDPEAPPDTDELGKLLALIDRIGTTVEPSARRSLAAFAASLATTPQAAEAARAMAVELGITDSAVTLAPATTSAGLSPEEIAALADTLDGADASARERIRDFLGSGRYRAYGLPTVEMRAMVRGWIGELAATGLGELAFPGVTCKLPDQRPFMVAFEELATGDLSLLVKWGVQMGLYGGAIYNLGTERHHARLPAVARGEDLGCFAMTEVGHGSNVADLETVARYHHATRELVIHTPSESARKEWIGGAAHDARMAVVFAQLVVPSLGPDASGAAVRHGVHAVLVPIRDAAGTVLPGVRAGDCGEKLGLNGVDNGRLWFEEVRVPVDNLLDRFAKIDENGTYTSAIASPSKRFFVMLGTLVAGRITVGSAGVSAARTGLAIAIRYAMARRQFGKAASPAAAVATSAPSAAMNSTASPEPTAEPPRERLLLDYPSHRRRLLPHLATNVVLRLAFATLRDRHAAGFLSPTATEVPDNRALEADAAALKILGSRHGVEALQSCREACGGQGYLSANRIGDLRVDAEIFTTFEGDNTVLAQLVAKSVLAGYQKQFADGGALAVLRLVKRRIGDIVVDPILSRRTSTGHLRDRGMQLAALRYREQSLTASVASRLKKRIDEQRDPETAFLEVQEHLLSLADAYADRLALEWFALAEMAAPAEARGPLSLLGHLHALALLERRAGWYLEDDHFEASKVRAIRREVEALLGEVAAIAPGVLEAFRLRDAIVAAPIAFFDPAHPRYA